MSSTIYRWKNCADYNTWTFYAILLSIFLRVVFLFPVFIMTDQIALMVSSLILESIEILALILVLKQNKYGMYLLFAMSAIAVSADLLANGLAGTNVGLISVIKDSSIIFFLLFLLNNDYGLNGYQVLNIAKTNGQYLKDLIEEEENNKCSLKDVTISKTLDNEIRIDMDYYPYSGIIAFSNRAGYVRVHEGIAMAYCIPHNNGKPAIIHYADNKPRYYDDSNMHSSISKENFEEKYPDIIAKKEEGLAEFKDILCFDPDDEEASGAKQA